jgi:hypothetical protein
VQCWFFVVFVVLENRAGETMRVELLSPLIHLFEHLLVEQFGLAPALAKPRPDMFPE